MPRYFGDSEREMRPHVERPVQVTAMSLQDDDSRMRQGLLQVSVVAVKKLLEPNGST